MESQIIRYASCQCHNCMGVERGICPRQNDTKEAVERSDNSAMIAIALLDEKLKFYNEPISAHDAIDEYNDIMKRWRSAKAS